MNNLADVYYTIDYSINGDKDIDAAISSTDNLDGCVNLLNENNSANIEELVSVEAELVQEIRLPATLEASNNLECTIGEAISIDIDSVNKYIGSYKVSSKPFEDYSLPTENKMLMNNIVVEKIKTYEVSNDYGTTINIGG